MKISIIIPVLNEEEALGHTLKFLSGSAHEIIVVDGGSTDRSKEVAQRYTSHILGSPPGRGRQQNKGAQHAHGDVFLFLHADTLLPRGFEEMMRKTFSNPMILFGAFRLSIYPASPMLNLIALIANLRSRLLKIPYGDQGLFIRRADYFRVGGFKDIPLMEDVDMVRRLNKTGRFKLATGSIKTSARRWEKEGAIYTTIRNWSLITRYLLGVSPDRLHHFYSNSR